MDTLLQVLPDLSVPVISIVALVYVIKIGLEKADKMHIAHVADMKSQHDMHAGELKESQTVTREIEREIRSSIIKQLNDNTEAFKQVLRYMDNKR